MTQRRRLGWLAATVAVGAVVLTGCGSQGTYSHPKLPAASDPAGPPTPGWVGHNDQLVLRVASMGGFVGPSVLLDRLPAVSVYGDGRVYAPGPVPAVYPGPAIAPITVTTVPIARVRALLAEAAAAGVGSVRQAGRPPVPDVPMTVISAYLDGRLVSTAVSGFATETPGTQPQQGGQATQPGQAGGAGPAGKPAPVGTASAGTASAGTASAGKPGQPVGPSGKQPRSVARLLALRADLLALARPGRPMAPAAIAVVASPLPAFGSGGGPINRGDRTWRGPDPTEGVRLRGAGPTRCLLLRGPRLDAVRPDIAAARQGDHWLVGGQPWSMLFRPLLPDEHSCADLLRTAG